MKMAMNDFKIRVNEVAMIVVVVVVYPVDRTMNFLALPRLLDPDTALPAVLMLFATLQLLAVFCLSRAKTSSQFFTS